MIHIVFIVVYRAATRDITNVMPVITSVGQIQVVSSPDRFLQFLFVVAANKNGKSGLGTRLNTKGWYSDISCTPIFVLSHSVNLLNICFDR